MCMCDNIRRATKDHFHMHIETQSIWTNSSPMELIRCMHVGYLCVTITTGIQKGNSMTVPLIGRGCSQVMLYCRVCYLKRT